MWIGQEKVDRHERESLVLCWKRGHAMCKGREEEIDGRGLCLAEMQNGLAVGEVRFGLC